MAAIGENWEIVSGKIECGSKTIFEFPESHPSWTMIPVDKYALFKENAFPFALVSTLYFPDLANSEGKDVPVKVSVKVAYATPAGSRRTFDVQEQSFTKNLTLRVVASSEISSLRAANVYSNSRQGVILLAVSFASFMVFALIVGLGVGAKAATSVPGELSVPTLRVILVSVLLGLGSGYSLLFALRQSIAERVVSRSEPTTTSIANGVSEPNSLLSGGAKLEAGKSPSDSYVINRLGMTMKWIKGGDFTMGSPVTEKGRDEDEAQVPVTLSGYWIAQHEVTREQWTQLMRSTPWELSKGIKDETNEQSIAATFITYDLAIAFCQRLTELERQNGIIGSDWEYTLPTEAQWEFACRAGATTRFYFGDNEVALGEHAWTLDSNTVRDFPYEVGQKRPNSFGLFDMHGNAWEYCRDGYVTNLPGGVDPCIEGTEAVLRGGSFGTVPRFQRSAERWQSAKSRPSESNGFRVVASSISAHTKGNDGRSYDELFAVILSGNEKEQAAARRKFDALGDRTVPTLITKLIAGSPLEVSLANHLILDHRSAGTIATQLVLCLPDLKGPVQIETLKALLKIKQPETLTIEQRLSLIESLALNSADLVDTSLPQLLALLSGITADQIPNTGPEAALPRIAEVLISSKGQPSDTPAALEKQQALTQVGLLLTTAPSLSTRATVAFAQSQKALLASSRLSTNLLAQTNRMPSSDQIAPCLELLKSNSPGLRAHAAKLLRSNPDGYAKAMEILTESILFAAKSDNAEHLG